MHEVAADTMTGAALTPVDHGPTGTADIPSAASPNVAPAEDLAEPDDLAPRAHDDFLHSVAPMLARNCSPCHVENGKMYARLPFDNPEVVLAHKDAILRRLKTPDDKRALEEWTAGRE